MNWFKNLDVNEIKKAYRKLVMEWHPDRAQYTGKDANEATKMMKAINNAYHAALQAFHGKKYNVKKDSGETQEWTYYYNAKKEQEIMDKLEELVGLELSADAEIWLVGFWIWVVNTDKKIDYKPMKDAKMRWHSKREAWYWRQAKHSSTFNKSQSLSGLAKQFGLEVHQPNRAQNEDEETRGNRKAQPALVG